MNTEKEYAQFQFFQPPALFANWFIFTLKTESSPPGVVSALKGEKSEHESEQNLGEEGDGCGHAG